MRWHTRLQCRLVCRASFLHLRFSRRQSRRQRRRRRPRRTFLHAWRHWRLVRRHVFLARRFSLRQTRLQLRNALQALSSFTSPLKNLPAFSAHFFYYASQWSTGGTIGSLGVLRMVNGCGPEFKCFTECGTAVATQASRVNARMRFSFIMLITVDRGWSSRCRCNYRVLSLYRLSCIFGISNKRNRITSSNCKNLFWGIYATGLVSQSVTLVTISTVTSLSILASVERLNVMTQKELVICICESQSRRLIGEN